MASSFKKIPDKGHFGLQIINLNNDTATENIRDEIEKILLNNFEYVFSYGVGSNETLSRSEYGYVIPNSSMWVNDLTDIKTQLNKINNVDINVNLFPFNLTKDDFDSMRQIGERKGLDALQDFVDEMNDR